MNYRNSLVLYDQRHLIHDCQKLYGMSPDFIQARIANLVAELVYGAISAGIAGMEQDLSVS